jgi:hypothetical protein
MLIWFMEKGGAYAEVEDIVPCLVCRWEVRPLLVPEFGVVETAGARKGGVGPLGELAGAGGTLSWRMEEMEAVS